MSEKKSYKKKLLKNTMVFAIGNFSSRILVFFLVPLYTRTLSNYEYGSIDLITVTVTFLLPLFTLNLHEAIIRFCLDKNTNKKDVLSVGVNISGIGCLLIILISPIIMKIFGMEKYILFFILTFIVSAFKNILSYYAKGMERVKLVVSLGFIETIILLILNIILLVWLDFGLYGYYISNIISSFIVLIGYVYFLKIRVADCFKKNSIKLTKEMLRYSLPMIPNSMCWWISNTSDKYMVTYFSGVAASGLYAIAYKVPSLLNTITSIFMQAWQISAVEEFKNKKEENFSEVYRFLFGMNMIVCIMLILFSNAIARVMFSTGFYDAVVYVPILLGAYFFNGMASYLGTIYTASKKTKMLFISTLVGAIINIIINLILIPIYGAYGAAIATLISYFVIWLIRLINTKKIINIKYNKLLTILQIMALLAIIINRSSNVYGKIELISICSILIINFTAIKRILLSILNIFQKVIKKGILKGRRSNE